MAPCKALVLIARGYPSYLSGNLKLIDNGQLWDIGDFSSCCGLCSRPVRRMPNSWRSSQTPGTSPTNIASPELVKIFNSRTRNWPNGTPITIVFKDPSSGDMQLVVRKLFNMTTDQARAFVHAHPGQIVIADSEEAVLRFVSSTRGAIGIIDLYSLTKDVHVLKIDGKLPVEQGYLLRGN